MNSILIIGLSITLFFSLISITDIYAQTRDLEAEYCTKNWITDKMRCAEYIPDDYPENPKYELEQAEKIRQEAQQLKSEQESERVCPIGSHISTDNQGSQICVDSTGRFTGYPNIGGAGLSGDTGLYIGIAVVIIIIIAIIGITMKKKSEPESYKEVERKDFTFATKERVKELQHGKCAICERYPTHWEFDHIYGRGDNSIENCQGLCRDCHQEKTLSDNF